MDRPVLRRRIARAPWRRPRFPLLLLLLGAGCRQEVTEVAGPGGGGPPVDTTGTGTVQRLTLTVAVQADRADSAVTRQLGFTGGVLADAEVVARREGSSDRATGRTDAQGIVRFPDLLPGRWSVSASRVLSAAERQRLRAEDQDVTAWGGAFAGQVNLSATVPISAAAGRRGSLVISEIFEFSPPDNVVTASGWGNYLELYNNSDTTIYLDAKIVGAMLPQLLVDANEKFNCARLAPLRLDTLGIWTGNFWQLPGSGTQYPLLPGRAAVLAIDAIDHRVTHPELLDLSAADFEFLGTAQDVDNPTVPNIQPLASRGANGRGPLFWGGPEVFFVADRLPPGRLVERHRRRAALTPDVSARRRLRRAPAPAPRGSRSTRRWSSARSRHTRRTSRARA